MEMDDPLGDALARQLDGLATEDHEKLAQQVRAVLGDECPDDMCIFLLEMSNWSVPRAIGSFYDSDVRQTLEDQYAISRGLYSLSFESDGNCVETVPPNTSFSRTWTFRNTGNLPWPPGTKLQFVYGTPLLPFENVLIGSLMPGYDHNIEMQFRSPQIVGMYESRYQIMTGDGVPFGDLIFLILQVEEDKSVMDLGAAMEHAFIGYQDPGTSGLNTALHDMNVGAPGAPNSGHLVPKEEEMDE